MATATKNKTNKTKNLNESLVNATTATINATIENGEKWQKLTKKLIKKSEPVRRKQMDMVFETATAVKAQVTTGTERALDLVGYEQIMEYAKNNPISKKVVEATDSIKAKVNENPVVQQVGKTTENLKTKGTAKLNDIKEDVLDQAQKIINKGEEMVEEALNTNKAEKPAAKAKATTAAKSTAKAKTTAAPKATTTATKKASAKAETATEKPVENK